jgi:hypothetical protein
MSLLHLRSFFPESFLRSNNQQICLLLILVSLRLLFSPFKIDRDLYLVQRDSDLLYMDVDRNIRAFRLFVHVSFVFLSSFLCLILIYKKSGSHAFANARPPSSRHTFGRHDTHTQTCVCRAYNHHFHFTVTVLDSFFFFFFFAFCSCVQI